MLRLKDKDKTQTKTGKLEAVTTMSPTAIDGRYKIAFLVDGVWYNKFGKDGPLRAAASRVKVGEKVKIVFKSKVVPSQVHDGGIKLFELDGIWSASAERGIVSPAPFKWSLATPNGKLDRNKLRNALRYMASDCLSIISEIDHLSDPDNTETSTDAEELDEEAKELD